MTTAWFKSPSSHSSSIWRKDPNPKPSFQEIPHDQPLRLNLHNVGVDPRVCQKWGNETYCY